MKTTSTLSLFIALFCSGLSPAFAEDLKCGDSVTIPESLLIGLTDLACIALDEKIGVAVISGTRGVEDLEVRAIRVSSHSSGPSIIDAFAASQTTARTIPAYAFAQSCGLPLYTARIVSEEEVLLVFDSFTLLLWNGIGSGAAEVTAVSSDFDPEGGYTCHGVMSGIDTGREYFGFDTENRTFTFLEGYRRGPTRTVNF